MTLSLRITLVSIFILLPILESARILGIFTIHSRSHHSINQPIVKGLATRGHQVTIISHFKSETTQPNYTEIVIGHGLPSYIDSIPVHEVDILNSVRNLMLLIKEIEKATCETILTLDYIQRLLHSKEKLIDLIMVEMYYTQCYNLLAEKLDVPVITILPPTTTLGIDIQIGNPANPATLPVAGTPFTTNMGFFERILNTYHYAIYYICHYSYFNNYMDALARKYVNIDELPSMEVLQRRVALTFYNDHVSFLARPMAPTAVDIGGVHIKPAKALPKDIQEFVDGAQHGVLFFSFGTTIKASSISTEKMNIMKRVFARIPQKVLWRIDDPKITSFPANVLAKKWFPQRDLLEHENVRAFISHCGIFGTMEAMYTGTPVIAMPFLFDQQQNANILVEKRVAVRVDYGTLTEDAFISAIKEIINNTRYRKNAKHLSTVFKDRLVSPLDTAIYWTEYVLRHNGAAHLRPVSADMPLYQYLLLDVLAFLTMIVVLVIYTCKQLFKYTVAYFSKLNRTEKFKKS